MLARLEAGCAAPVGALGELSDDGELGLRSVVVSVDGSRGVWQVFRAPAADVTAATELGVHVADMLLRLGAAELAPVGPAGAGQRDEV